MSVIIITVTIAFATACIVSAIAYGHWCERKAEESRLAGQREMALLHMQHEERMLKLRRGMDE